MTLQILWYLLIALLIIGYYVLDGFDLGAGVLSPFIAKTEPEKKAVVESLGPVWDGNEVWLLTAGGALFAAFAPAYATTFSGFYLAILLVLFGLIVRAVSLEFRSNDEAWRKLWDALFFLGSLVPALLFGVALGNCLQGIPLAMNGDYTGTFLGLLTLFPLVCGLLGLSTIITQGACWLAAKIEEGTELQARAVKTRKIMFIVTIVLACLAAALYFGGIHTAFQGVAGGVTVIGAILLVAGFVCGLVFGAKGKDWLAFLSNCVVCAAFVILYAAALFPNFVVSTGVGPNIDIANAAGSDLTLTVMTIIACIGVPLVLIYHVIVYRTFRGKVPVES